MSDELVGFRPVAGEADDNRIVAITILKRRKLGGNSFARCILIGEQHRGAAERVNEQRLEGYGVPRYRRGVQTS